MVVTLNSNFINIVLGKALITELILLLNIQVRICRPSNYF